MAKSELLRNVGLFSKLGQQEIDIVAAHSAYYHYSAGATVFDEGSVHDELYIIKSGEVVITKRTEGGRTVDLARYVSGECFGELAMLDSKPRTATATAATDTTLLVFPERNVSFQDLLQRHPTVFAQILHKLLAIIAGRIRSTNELISEKSPWVQTLRRQLLSDELTGLYTRTFLEEDFLELLPTYGRETCLAMLKPDNFKAINDTCGHEAGDAVLKLLAQTVCTALGSKDLAVRYRGNEIAVVFPGMSLSQAKRRAEELVKSIASLDIAPVLGGKPIPLTASAGVAAFPHDSSSAKELVDKAFHIMWEAREAGGNRVFTAKAAPR